MRPKLRTQDVQQRMPAGEAQEAAATRDSGATARGRKRFGDAEIEQFLRLEQSGIAVSALCTRYGFTLAEFFRWKARYAMNPPSVTADEITALRAENQLLRDLVASLLSNARRDRPHAVSPDRHHGSSRAIESGTAASRHLPLHTAPVPDD